MAKSRHRQALPTVLKTWSKPNQTGMSSAKATSMESATPAYFASPQLSALTGGRSRQDASAHSRHSSPCITTPLMHNGARMHSTHIRHQGEALSARALCCVRPFTKAVVMQCQSYETAMRTVEVQMASSKAVATTPSPTCAAQHSKPVRHSHVDVPHSYDHLICGTQKTTPSTVSKQGG